MTAQPLGDPADRQSLRGGAMLAGLEAELLGDDPNLRGQLSDLVGLLRAWSVAADHAVAGHVRVTHNSTFPAELQVPGQVYGQADLDKALANYEFARGLVLTACRAVADLAGEPPWPLNPLPDNDQRSTP